MPRPTPFEPIVIQRGKKAVVISLPSEPPTEKLDRLRTSLVGMHREVVDQREKHRLQQMAQSKGAECNFSVRGFGLWSRVDSRLSVNKLLACWVGLFAVVDASPHSYTIRHLVTDQRYTVHGSRLKFYSDSNLDVDEDMLTHVGNQGMILGVEEVKQHRKDRGEWQALISWEGLQDGEDYWEPLQTMATEVPVRVASCVRSTDDRDLNVEFDRILRQWKTN